MYITTDLAQSFGHLGVLHYLDRFTEHGFENWQTLACMTEEDFDFLGVKLGHRSIIQREIARMLDLVANHTEIYETQSDSEAGNRTETFKGDSVSGDRVKRRYRRHPKPDENAPRRPCSAYAMFSNKIHKDVQGQNLSSVELARFAGERWQALTPPTKQPWTSNASAVKKTYDAEISKYRKTDNYTKCSTYLTEFKSRHPKQEAEENAVGYPNQTKQGSGQDGQSPQTCNSIEPAVMASRKAGILVDENGRQESLIFNVQELIGHESESRSSSNLDRSNFLGRADFDTSRADNVRHVRVINPFDHVTRSEVRPYLDCFLHRINCIFYFFDAGELIDLFDSVFEANRSLPNQIMSEICLVLALGVQTSDQGSEDKLIMWYENGRRYLDDENWRNKLWVMRAMILVSAYHVGERRDTARHYLGLHVPISNNRKLLTGADIAIDIGRANGLRIRQSEFWQPQDNERMKWLQVWRTAEFLEKYESV